MSETFMDLLVKAYNRPDPKPYLFEPGQKVRVLKGRSEDGQTPHYWNGAMAVVVGRYTTGIHKEHWYKLHHVEKNVVDEFREEEIDARYRKKT